MKRRSHGATSPLPRPAAGTPMGELSPQMPAGGAALIVLRQLDMAMEKSLAGVWTGQDAECLHDFRVAVRRTRSLLGELRDVMPVEAVQRFRPEFKWLGEITGPTRDLDVYLLNLPAYRRSLPDSMQKNLQPLQDFLVRHQRLEQRRLARRLGSARCRHLLADWRDFTTRPEEGLLWPGRASRPIVEIASGRIWKTYRRVIKAGTVIDADSPATALHQLRIDCKKLRYLMEFFQCLYPVKPIAKQVTALKVLQDNLGNYQDLQVQGEALRRFARVMQEEQASLPGETLIAIGQLIGRLGRHQGRERRRFAASFADFARPASQRQCRKLFSPPVAGT